MSNKVSENTAKTSTIAVLRKTEFLGKTLTVFGTIAFPLFLAKEVADWLEHSNARMMLQCVDDDEKQCVKNPYALKGQQEQWFLTEYGLYEVLMQSRKPIAKEFKKGVKKILKDIRQEGYYAAPNVQEELNKMAQAYKFEKMRADTYKQECEIYKTDSRKTNELYTNALGYMKDLVDIINNLKKKQKALPEPTPIPTTPIINIVKRTKINDKPLTVFATQEGQLLFWAKQVKGWFGQSSTPNMMTHVKDENKFLLFNPSNIYGGTKAWFITEEGLNDLFYRYGYCGGMDLEGYKSGLREIIRACK